LAPPARKPILTWQDYVAIEESSSERHMFWDGEVFVMAGASFRHSALETRLIILLGAALQGKPCQPVVSNQRLRAIDSERTVYADGMILCGPPRLHPETRLALTNPTVVFEILSPTTEAFDRGDKFAYYRSFPSLRSVVLISQHTHRVEHFRRDDQGGWRLLDLGMDDTLRLIEVDAELHVGALYEGIGMEEAE
jgi:Uma2 family endonuclease